MQVRILVKVIPQSMNLVSAGPEGGGNNRISEEQIKCVMVKVSSFLHVPLLVSWASCRNALWASDVGLHDMGVAAVQVVSG